MRKLEFTIEDARRIGNQLDVNWGLVDVGEFLKGMNVELEHGLVHERTNITNDNDLVTGKIALAHLNESRDYYRRLEQMEKNPLLFPMDMSHYYGNRVRQLFFIAAGIMLVGLPFVRGSLAVPEVISILGVLVLDFLAALTNPRQVWVNWVNTAIAALAMIIFELFAVRSFSEGSSFFFVVNQGLALIFLIALYFNTKTLRAMLLKP